MKTYVKTYVLAKKTKVYMMDGRCIVFQRLTPFRLYDNGIGKEVVFKIRETIILLRRDQQIDDNVRPVSVYVNGEFVGFCNYKNPPFPLSLLY
jgi:hypothetical protein